MSESTQQVGGVLSKLTQKQKIGVGVGVGLTVLVIGIVLYVVFNGKDTTKPRCKDADKCNKKMYEWIVTNNWKFDDSRKNWNECAACESVWYKRTSDGKNDSITSKDGKVWKTHKDAKTAYEYVKV